MREGWGCWVEGRGVCGMSGNVGLKEEGYGGRGEDVD